MMKKIFGLFLILALGAGAFSYFAFFKSNVGTPQNKVFVYIHEGDSYETVMDQLCQSCINNPSTLRLTARLFNYADKLVPGRYELTPGMNNIQLVRRLIHGNQAPVRITFNNIRTQQKLAETLTRNLEMTEEDLLAYLTSEEILTEYGKTKENIITLFRPNTYEFYWNTTPEKLVSKIAKEYDKLWNSERMNKLEEIGFSKDEVMTLASIVEEETAKNDEKPMVAGLYINRLKIGMLLQADPTIKFALQDFSIKRIYTNHIEAAASSPYNTYKHLGLPPGPIRIPTTESIDAVLNYTHHNYIYMCAKEDFSGYHSFCKSYEEHKANASRYRKELDERKIK